MRTGIPERLCGRPFSHNDLRAIKEEVQGGYSLSRMEIARRVCVRLNCGNSLGQPQLMSCRVGLLRLHRLGFIELPPPLTRNGNGKGLVRQKAKLPPLIFLEAALQSLTGLRLDRVRTPEESAYWNGLIDEYHYLGYKPLPGAQVRYLIRWDGGDLGAIGFSAAAWKVGVCDQWIGWDALTREKGLRLIVNNARFLVLPNIRVKNLASRVHSLCAGRIRVDFSETDGCVPAGSKSPSEFGGGGAMNEWVTGEWNCPVWIFLINDWISGCELFWIGWGASLPAACKGWDETFESYRFFHNGKVTEQKVLSAHRDATRKRIAEHKVALCIQDTTEMDFTGRKLKGAGPLSVPERIGFFNHVTLAVTPERLCLGVLDASMWACDFEDLNKNDKRKQKPIGEKESYRWLEGYRKLCDLSEQTPGTMLVSISDREGDICECFVEVEGRRRAEYVIRGCQDRSLPEKLEDGCYPEG